jgi:uncharacterized membrane protein
VTDREGAITPLEETFNVVANYVALGVEFGAVIVVAFGSAQAVLALIGAIAAGTADSLRGREIWLKFATWILLALEFAPTWDDIWKLAVIAVVRTMLNYFLAKDIAAFSKLEEAPQDNSTQNRTPGPVSP